MTKFPVVFSGHGDPMIALRDDGLTRGMKKVGDMIIAQCGKPKAILAISAHWYKKGTFIQTEEEPRQVYDMYGFPDELYEVVYPVKGCGELSERVMALLGDDVSINDKWGIDHGTWTVLKHMFPDASIPVVQLSVDATISREKMFEIGQKLAALRDEGYLIFGSGNVVHNLRLVEWDNAKGTDETLAFNQYIVSAIIAQDYDRVIHYENGPHAAYAVPTPDHYLPLIYCLGAAGDDQAFVFNNVCNLGSMAMTGFIFGLGQA